MNELQIFQSEEFSSVRVMQIDGEPWFVAADVCTALEIGNSRQAITRLDDDEKGVISTDTLGGAQDALPQDHEDDAVATIIALCEEEKVNIEDLIANISVA